MYVQRQDGELIPTENGLEDLESEEFIICYNKSELNPRYYEFFCCVCSKHVKGLQDCMTHWRNSKHKRDAKSHYNKVKYLRKIPNATENTEKLLSEFVRNMVNLHALTEDDLALRVSICQQVETCLQHAGFESLLFCRTYGSGHTGIGFHDADIDVDVQYDAEKLFERNGKISDKASIYVRIYETLQSSDMFCDVLDMFHQKYPKLVFTHIESGLRCCISPNHENRPLPKTVTDDVRDDKSITQAQVFSLHEYFMSILEPINIQHDEFECAIFVLAIHHGFHTSELLKTYMKLDERARYLCLFFKLWSKICGIDEPKLCGLPPYSFTLMAIHYLQQIEPPVLPVIKVSARDKGRLLDPERETKSTINMDQIHSWKSRNTSNLGRLLNDLFRYYLVKFNLKALVITILQVTPLSKQQRQFGSNRRVAIEDPFVLKDNIANSLCSNAILKYMLECMERTWKYFLNYKPPKYLNEKELIRKRERSRDAGENRSHDAQQVVEMQASDDDEDVGGYGSSQSSDSDVIIESEHFVGDDAAVDHVKTNGIEVVPANDDAAVDHVKTNGNEVVSADGDVAVDHVKTNGIEVVPANGDVAVDHVKTNGIEVVPADGDVAVEQVKTNGNEVVSADGDVAVNQIEKSLAASVEGSRYNGKSHSDESVQAETELIKNNGESELNCVTEMVDQLLIDEEGMNEDTAALKIEADDTPLNFGLLPKNFTSNKQVPLMCCECMNEGHTYENCPYIYFSVKELPPLTKDFAKILDAVCQDVMASCQLTAQEFDSRKKLLRTMEEHLRIHFRANCRLSLFGSSVNCFGFQGSDMDICLRFKQDKPPANLDYGEMVVQISKALDKSPQFEKVMYIKSAKVPIVKFNVPAMRLEGDISLYNCLALDNSAMLAMYTQIDERVRMLGYCMKVLAKKCQIGDASRGSLSSYAHILLVLYYLQHCEPPVIPVLQELYDPKKGKPERIVEGWNTWFYQDLKYLKTIWPGYHKNKQSVGELWVGFFRFYLKVFDFNKDVVAIKQQKKLTKFEKSWTQASIAIEDPFNLNHNLGAGIRRNMFKYIMSCFIHTWSRFGNPAQTLPKGGILEKQMYLFDEVALTGNKDVPTDRLCRRCGRIGHQAAHCAEKYAAQRDMRKRRDSEKTQEEQQRDDYSIDSNRRDTPKKDRNKKVAMDASVKCFACGVFGHRKIDCPLHHGDGFEIKNTPKKKTASKHRADSDAAYSNTNKAPGSERNEKNTPKKQATKPTSEVFGRKDATEKSEHNQPRSKTSQIALPKSEILSSSRVKSNAKFEHFPSVPPTQSYSQDVLSNLFKTTGPISFIEPGQNNTVITAPHNTPPSSSTELHVNKELAEKSSSRKREKPYARAQKKDNFVFNEFAVDFRKANTPPNKEKSRLHEDGRTSHAQNSTARGKKSTVHAEANLKSTQSVTPKKEKSKLATSQQVSPTKSYSPNNKNKADNEEKNGVKTPQKSRHPNDRKGTVNVPDGSQKDSGRDTTNGKPSKNARLPDSRK